MIGICGFSLSKELLLALDFKTQWKSLLDMHLMFREVKINIKMATSDFSKDCDLSTDDL